MKFIISLLLLSTLAGCNSDDSNNHVKGTLIFGWFASSNCSGDCSQIFKIDGTNVYQNINHDYPDTPFFEGEFELMTDVNYQDYKVLLNQLPNEIHAEPNGYLDCTDCTNENGGFYLEFEDDNGIRKSWRFRNAVFPEYMESYRSLLLEKIAELSS